MTNLLKELLSSYGLLYIALSQLLEERPGNKYASLDEYYESLGLSPHDTLFVVQPSTDGKSRFLDEGEHNIEVHNADGNKVGKVEAVLELPEDEFYFFKAFRPALFDLEKDLPPFIFEMTLIHAHSLFESYLSDTICLRYQKHPELMGVNKHLTYGEVINKKSKQDILEYLISREVGQLMYEPIGALLEKLRSKYGFGNLTAIYDQEIIHLSLIRNCLMHNAGKVDSKLSAQKPELVIGEKISVDKSLAVSAINTFRKFCYQVDIISESMC